MSRVEFSHEIYEDLMSRFGSYDNIYSLLYKLKATNEEEIDQIYTQIKEFLIKTNKTQITQILNIIYRVSYFRNRYLKSYFKIFAKINKDFDTNDPGDITHVYLYFLDKEIESVLSDEHKEQLKNFYIQNYTLDVHPEGTIYRAIMDDDEKSFIYFINQDDFDENSLLKSDLYPAPDEGGIEGYSYIELCCYHGSTRCFKILRSELNTEITPMCLKFSFLGGDQEIISDCLTELVPDNNCMDYAIISHNIAYIEYLANNHDISINLDCCATHFNLQALIIYLDQTKGINKTFIYSARFDCLDLVKYFIEHGVDINAKDELGATALVNAAINSSIEVIEYLISKGADINGNGGVSPLYFCIAYSRPEILEYLISKGADVNGNGILGYSLLYKAFELNNDYIVKCLLSNGADVNTPGQYGYRPLHLAVLSNNMNMAELLILNSADVNVQDIFNKTPILYAMEKLNIEMIKFLLANGATLNVTDLSVIDTFHDAAFKNNKEIVELLISLGVEINSKNINGETALHKAATNNSKETAEYLILKGAEINAKDNSGRTPLHYAALFGCKEMTESLITHFANINSKDNDGQTPLHTLLIGRNFNEQIAEYLVLNGTEINTKDYFGWTPLKYAMMNIRFDFAKFLINHGADENDLKEIGATIPNHMVGENI